MRNKRITPVICLAAILLLTAGCGTTSRVSLQNLASLYKADKQFADIAGRVYHTNDSVSTVFVKILYSDLVYQKDPYSGVYNCSYRLTYELKAGYDANEIISSSSIVSGDSLNYGKSGGTVHIFEFRAKFPGEYLLKIELFDLHRQASSLLYLPVDKKSMSGRNNFMVLNRNQELIFEDYIPAGEPFRIICDKDEITHLNVNFYHRDFPVARPPYTEDREMVFDYKPDSLYSVLMLNGESEWHTLNREGFYHFISDTTSREGLTLFCFPGGFPEITTAEQLREPLRYITTKKEFDTLTESTQVKAAVDDFWLKTARTPERARNLIQKYYSNVEEANKYFTSYLEGWKTDRGIIYIIFGQPDFVYRGKDSEEWIYGEPQNRGSLRYTFVKVNNPFTDNDYMLLRSPTLKDSWFVTVQSWRR